MTPKQKREIESELSWFWLVYPSIVSTPSAHQVLVNVCSGLCGAPGERDWSERVSRALLNAKPIRDALAAVTSKSRRVLRLAFDPCQGQSIGELGNVVDRYCRGGSRAERRIRAELLLARALREYAGKRAA